MKLTQEEALAREFCGARTKRTGEPCKQRAIYSNGRCKFHGGLSTGPRTPEGKAKCALNLPHKHKADATVRKAKAGAA